MLCLLPVMLPAQKHATAMQVLHPTLQDEALLMHAVTQLKADGYSFSILDREIYQATTQPRRSGAYECEWRLHVSVTGSQLRLTGDFLPDDLLVYTGYSYDNVETRGWTPSTSRKLRRHTFVWQKMQALASKLGGEVSYLIN